ncbi:MAG: FG-GAP repeat protein [Planctomycetota bacterium]
MRPRTHRLRRATAALLPAVLALHASAYAQTNQTLFAPDGATGDSFGAVGASGETVAIGAPGDDDVGVDSGSVRTFRDQAGTYVTGPKLIGSSVGPGDRFGSAVSVDGDRMLVGAPNDDDRGLDAGAAYAFRRVGGAWVEDAKITSFQVAPDAFFGSAVALSGDIAVVGAYHAGQGSAHVFRSVGSGSWVEEQVLTSSAGLYGFSVAASGDRVAVGGFESVDVWVRSGSGTWSRETTLSSPAGPGGVFGNAVALDGDRLVVGAWVTSLAAQSAGAAFVYHRIGGSWVFDATLTASDGAAQDFFGGAVAVWGDRVLVGAHADDDLGPVSGSAYLFEMESGAWVEQQKLLAANGAAWDGFGGSVVVGPTSAIVGSANGDGAAVDSGTAYATRLPEPIGARLDLVPRRTEAWYAAPGLIDVSVDYSLLLGGDIDIPSVAFDVEVVVNGVTAGTQTVTETLALGIPTCYSSNVPCVAGGCPGTVRCEWVDLPGTMFDYCACDWIGSLVMTVPGFPGDDVLVILDPLNSVEETREGNNLSAFVAADVGKSYCEATPNSTGETASITAFGSAVVGQNDLDLRATGLPAGAPNLFVLGPEAQAAPLGDGTLCIGGSLLRVMPPNSSDASGVARESLDLTQSPWANTLVPGSTWRFQNWFRDGGSPYGFHLSDATSVAFSAEGEIPDPTVTADAAFRDPLAHVVGNPVYFVSDMLGAQTFVNTPDFGRLLIEIDAIELYEDGQGFVQLGLLEGDLVWGDAPFDGLVVDRRDEVAAGGWTPITSLTDFHTGLPGSNAELQVEFMSFNRVRTNGFEILTIRELQGFDAASGTQISAAPSDLDEILCESYWIWECVNTFCGGTCTTVTIQPNGKAKVSCGCNIGACNWMWLPKCMRINCTSACDLSGFWDLCGC